MPDRLVIAAAVFVAVAALVATGVTWWINRPQRIIRVESETLPLFGSDPESQVPESTVAATPTASATPVTRAPRAPASHVPFSQKAYIQSFTTSPLSAPDPVEPSSASRETAVSNSHAPGKMIEGQSVSFSVPDEGTLQFLPGRLEVVGGQDVGREIRFVRLPGPNGTEVTFGRSEGELYRHVQLHEKTVSRSHARMRLTAGRWELTNLSATNPITHNTRVLGVGEELLLDDGDRIEMGAVIFSFRAR